MANDTPVPDVLYKLMPERFTDSGPLIPFLSNGLVRFSPPGAMNDQLEERGFIDESDYKNEFDGILSTELDRAGKIPDPIRCLSERLKMYHVHGQLAARHVADPVKAKSEDWTRRFRRIDETFGILSLTANITSSAMWSHYANRHFGVAIGFDFTALAKFADPAKGFSYLRPVRYTTEMAKFKMSGGKVSCPSDIFFRKSPEWEYENEWRIFNTFEKVPKKHIVFSKHRDRYDLAITMVRMNLKWVKEIRLGICATSDTMSRVREFVRESMLPIKIYKMKASPTTYGLEEERIV